MLGIGKRTNLIKIGLAFAITNLCMTNGSFANGYSGISCFDNFHPLRPVLSLGLGAAFSSQIGKSKMFPIAANPVANEFFIYNAHSSTRVSALFDGFVGGETTYYPWALQIGIGFSQTWNFDSHGALLQGTDMPSATRYNYHYDILTRQVLVETKLLYHVIECYHPYIVLGVGAAFNEADGFATNVLPITTLTRQYGDNTQTSFTYTVGFGIDVNVIDSLRFGIGYRFADLGQVQLGHASFNTTRVAGTLSQNHLYTSEVLGQVTLLF